MMWRHPATDPSSLIERVESSIKETTHGRIRNLAVEEVQGRLVVRGNVPSYHTKQLALHATLALVPSDRFDAFITVA